MVERVAGCQNLNIKKEVLVTRADLPLHCPMSDSVAWCSHPRVFLAMEASKPSRCPYCGTVYRLIDASI